MFLCYTYNRREGITDMSDLRKECADPGCAEFMFDNGIRLGQCAVFTQLDIDEGVPGATDPNYCPAAHFIENRTPAGPDECDLPLFSSTAA
jgi:hypothetical protein